MKRQQYDDEVEEELRIDEMLLDEDSSSPSSNNNNGTTQSSSSGHGHGHGHSRGGNNIGNTIGTKTIDYNSVEACDGENMFSKALLNLNLNERNQIEEEIHGVSCMAITETPELIQESLKKFEIELKLIPIENKIAYQKAIELSKTPRSKKSTTTTTTLSYILRNDYKLSFLRTELFNVPKSVLRYINYLNLLYQVYGDCALRRPIRLQDLNKEEFTFLKSGQYQLLPYRDRSGRRIFAVVPNNKDHVPGKILMKVFLYLWSVCVGSGDDTYHAETQRRGVIIVIFPSGQQVYDTVNDARQLENNNKKDDDDNAIHNTTKYTKERLSVNHILAKLVPQRMTAIHICLPNSQIFGLVASFYGIALKSWNARTRIHLGNPTEIRYKLQQYGIPIELIPSTDTGNIKSVNLKQWIKLRMHLEREEQVAAQKMMIHNKNNNNKKSISCLYSSDSSDNGSGSSGGSGGGDYFAKIPNTKNTIVECPLSNDVIFRRGKAMQNIHLGNLKFQNLIEAHMYEHTIDLDTSPLRRIEIEIELMNEVRKKIETTNGCDSGRFLTWDVEKSWWLVMQSDDEIQKKIHYAFRDFRKKMLKQQQQQKKVQRISSSNLNSIFVRQDGRQKKKRCNDSGSANNNNTGNSCSGSSSGGDNYNGNSSDSDDNNNICNIPMPCSLPSTNNNNNGACGYFFSTDDGSYTNLDQSR